MVTEGNPAPDFELPSGDGDSVRLSEFRGRPVVLYFYPRDDTSGTVPQYRGGSARTGRQRTGREPATIPEFRNVAPSGSDRGYTG
jgi:hypothetical protein